MMEANLPLFIILTQVSPDAVHSPRSLEELERKVMAKVKNQCPAVEWLASYAVLGPYDYVDVFWAEDIETATKVSTLIRSFGHARTEVWAATEWARFKDVIRSLPDGT
ncbi:GYD domain-containing protein [Methylobacterium sp. P31]